MDKRITCKLTGIVGKGVRSHIIPRALTSPQDKGQPLFQLHPEFEVTDKRYTSWYDTSIVVKEGEDLLAAIDDSAIQALRRHKLIWDAFDDSAPRFQPVGNLSDVYVRAIDDFPQSDAITLWRFFASVLWRTCASELPEFRHITLPEGRLRVLRGIVCGARGPMPSWLPISLTQLTNPGVSHNRAPYIARKRTPKGVGPKKSTKFLRVFVDGLVAHIELTPGYAGEVTGNPLYLTGSTRLCISAREFEGSRELYDLEAQIRESLHRDSLRVRR